MIMSVVGVEQSRLAAHNANPDMSAGSFSSRGVFAVFKVWPCVCICIGDSIKGGIWRGLYGAVRSCTQSCIGNA